MSEFLDYEDGEDIDDPEMSETEQAEEKEREEAVPDNPLVAEMMPQCLSLLCKTGNGLAHAYVRLDIHQREISDISLLKHFVHLRFVDISENNIQDISPLNYLTNMLTLKADGNLLKSGKMNELPYLQQANFANNNISDVDGINHQLLEVLNLNENEISEISALDPIKLSRLTTLEMRSNKLSTTANLHLRKLKKLYLGDNAITSIVNIARLEHLTILHLRSNKLEKLDGFSENMKYLQYINLRKNNISDLQEVSKLKCLPMLRALILRENPICFEESYRVEILVILRRLERLDQDGYTEEERQEAEEIYDQRTETQREANGEGAIEVIQSEEDD